MGCYSSLGVVHSQLLHFHVLVFPIKIQKCHVITSLRFIYMQSASVAINCSDTFYHWNFFFTPIFISLFRKYISVLNMIKFEIKQSSKNCLHEHFAWVSNTSLLCKCNPSSEGGEKFEMAHLHCQMTQHSYFPFTIKLFCRHINLERISVCSFSPLSRRNNTALK